MFCIWLGTRPRFVLPLLSMQSDDLQRLAQARHSCKAFDPAQKIPNDQVEALLAVLRHAPSSVNTQPWHFVVASTEAGKAQLVQGLPGVFTYNVPKVQNASHALVLCRRTDLDDAYLNTLLEQEAQDGRFATLQAKEGLSKSRGMYVNMHRAQNDMAPWMEKQVYIALGMLLQGAAALGIDACPMEGFDQQALDAALGLPARGLTAVVMVALGYRSPDDFNATLPKSRFNASDVFTHL